MEEEKKAEEQKAEEQKVEEQKVENKSQPVITRSMQEEMTGGCESCGVEAPKIPANLPEASWSNEKLIKAISDDNMLIRSNAVMLLSKRDPAVATEPLIQAMKDKEYVVKSNAMVALSSFGRSLVDRMIEALSDPDPDIRAGAAWVLGEFKDPKSIEHLERVAKDEYPLARVQAKASLIAMGRGPKKEEKKPKQDDKPA